MQQPTFVSLLPNELLSSAEVGGLALERELRAARRERRRTVAESHIPRGRPDLSDLEQSTPYEDEHSFH